MPTFCPQSFLFIYIENSRFPQIRLEKLTLGAKMVKYLHRDRRVTAFSVEALLVNRERLVEEETVRGDGADCCRRTGFTIFGPPFRTPPSPLLELSRATEQHG